MQTGMERFVGAWRLVKSEQRDDNGNVIHPFGDDAQGLLCYTADGYMSAAIMNPRRPSFQTRDLHAGTHQEKIQATNGYLHYAGRFEVRDDSVIHHVEVSLFPNYVGTQQQRFYRFFDENKLELRTRPFTTDGVQKTAYIVWE